MKIKAQFSIIRVTVLTKHRGWAEKACMTEEPCQHKCMRVCVCDLSYGKTDHLLDSLRLVAIETNASEPLMRCGIKDQQWIWSDSRPRGAHDLFVRHVHV